MYIVCCRNESQTTDCKSIFQRYISEKNNFNSLININGGSKYNHYKKSENIKT